MPVDIDQRHEVLTNGHADVSIVFTTDPQIKRNDEVLLEDDKGMFPPYNSTFLMKTDDGRRGRARPGEDDRRGEQEPHRRRRCRSSTRASTSTRRRPQQAAAAYLKQFKLIPS